MTLSQEHLMDEASIPYTATPEVENVIASMGRTEDTAFSPDYKWLVISGYRKSKLYFLSTNITQSNNMRSIDIQKFSIIRSKDIIEPHGIAFLDNEHILIANRGGIINIFQVPSELGNNAEVDLKPVARIKSDFRCRVKAPGSIAVVKTDFGNYRVLAANNYIHTITSHKVDLLDGVKARNEGVLIRKELNIPDGLSVSCDRKWVAVSNHSTGTVLIYKFDLDLNRRTPPYGVLEGIVCPHGLRFSKDGNFLFVVDSGSAYFHIYKSTDGDWSSSRKPYKTVRILTDDKFIDGRYNAQEGGIKGLDINFRDNILVVTSEHLPLAFYDLDEFIRLPAVQVDEEIAEKSRERDDEIARM
jgi:WD40 repeat protein